LSFRFFFAAGPGHIIQAHKNWRDGIDDQSQMSITFSSEFEHFCEEKDAIAYLVSSACPAQLYADRRFILEHRPRKTFSGIKFHASQILYGLGLLKSAVAFRATHAFLQSGSTHYFVMSAFRLAGIKVVPIMHNTLWPSGYPPTTWVSRSILLLDALFFRWFASGTVAVSPECARQVDKITSGRHGPIRTFTIQFNPTLFRPERPPLLDGLAFKLLFAGRIEVNKGVFDLLKMMECIEKQMPGRVSLDICGDGPELNLLKEEHQKRQLGRYVTIHGWTNPNDLRRMLLASHVSIVPTRSGFAEGMAMTAIEPILLGRPVITNPVVPALEILRSACIEAKTNDPNSYAEAVLGLVQNPQKYFELQSACYALREQFFNQALSSRMALHGVLMESNSSAVP
jgi:glycosyltransferase involved in cell wall biosynthesis